MRDRVAQFVDRLTPDQIGAPLWVWPAVGIIGVALLLVAWIYFRAPAQRNVRLISAALKVTAFALLAFCLIEPLNSGLRPRQGANSFAILVDNSQSMQIKDPSGIDRPQQFAKLLDQKTAWRARLEQDFDVRTYAFDSRLQSFDEMPDLTFDGKLSGMQAALTTVSKRYQHRPLSGLLLFSDGNATDLRADAIDWSQLGYPVFPVIDAGETKSKDVAVDNVTIAQSDFEASPVTVSCAIKAQGLAGESLTVRLVDEQGKAIQDKTLIAPKDDDHADVRFQFRPEKAGVGFYRVQVMLEREKSSFENGDSGSEATLANNTQVAAVDRGRGPYRVLYVSGRPNWEFKFLRRALDEDDEVKLIGLLRIANREPKFTFRERDVSGTNPLFRGFEGKDQEEVERYDEPVLVRLGIDDPSELKQGFPKTAAELFAYHAIIIDDLEAGFFKPDQLQLLREFVSARGGGLLMLGGQESFVEGGYDRTPLGELSPVYLNKPAGEAPEGPFRLELTREGWLQPWTRVRPTEAAERDRLAKMPPFSTLNLAGQIKPGASILSTVATPDGKSNPALVVQRFGKGRSAAILIGDMWRWAMHRESKDEQDLQQAWRQTIRWLVADVPRRVEVQMNDDPEAATVKRIEVTVRDKEFKAQDNAKVTVTVTRPGGQSVDLSAEPSDVEAGLFAAAYHPDVDGGYRVTAKVVDGDGDEIGDRETGFSAQPAAREFEAIGVNSQTLEEIAKASGGEVISSSELSEFVTDLPNRKTTISERWTSPYWHQPWIFVLATLLLCAEWGLRRRHGLP